MDIEKAIEKEEFFYKSIGYLPTNLKNVMTLRHQNGMKYKEIASKLHISIGAAKMRNSNAMKIIGKWWKFYLKYNVHQVEYEKSVKDKEDADKRIKNQITSIELLKF